MALWIDDAFFDHPKIIKAGVSLAWKHLRAMAWTSRHRTGGVILRGAITELRIACKDAARLVEIGLWEPHPDGWAIHDWTVYNGDAQTSKGDRDANLAKRRKWREDKKRQRASKVDMSTKVQGGKSTGQSTHLSSPRARVSLPVQGRTDPPGLSPSPKDGGHPDPPERDQSRPLEGPTDRSGEETNGDKRWNSELSRVDLEAIKAIEERRRVEKA